MLIYIFVFLFIVILVLLLIPDKKDNNKNLNSIFDEKIEETFIEDNSTKNNKYLKLEKELKSAGLKFTPEQFIRLRYGLVVFNGLLFFILIKNIFIVIIVTIVSFTLPNVFLGIAKNKRKDALENQLLPALSMIRNTIKAGLGFNSALDIIAKEMAPPISIEFEQVQRDIQTGKDQFEALKDMAERTGSDELKLLVVALMINRESGGDMTKILDVIIETIRDRLQIKGEIKTLTSQGKLSATIIGLLPFVLATIMFVINPDYMKPLFSEKLGQVLLGLGIFFELVGIYFISKIIKIDF